MYEKETKLEKKKPTANHSLHENVCLDSFHNTQNLHEEQCDRAT